jgi:hypothetical protein
MQPERRPNLPRSPESLEARLRALPQPPIPADLEARLLAGIPAALPIRRWRWAVWVGLAGAAAAACLLIVLAWPRRDRPAPSPPHAPEPIAVEPESGRMLDEDELPAFHWPFSEPSPTMVSTAIPAEPLD